MKQPYKPANDGPGFARLTRDERFEAVRLETLRLQQQMLEQASFDAERRHKWQPSIARSRT